jgi:hypothetical protein
VEDGREEGERGETNKSLNREFQPWSPNRLDPAIGWFSGMYTKNAGSEKWPLAYAVRGEAVFVASLCGARISIECLARAFVCFSAPGHLDYSLGIPPVFSWQLGSLRYAIQLILELLVAPIVDAILPGVSTWLGARTAATECISGKCQIFSLQLRQESDPKYVLGRSLFFIADY